MPNHCRLVRDEPTIWISWLMTCCIIFRARWFKREQDVLNNDLIWFTLILRCAIECILFYLLVLCMYMYRIKLHEQKAHPLHASIMSPITAVSVEVNLARVQTDFSVFHIARVSNSVWTNTCRLFASPLSLYIIPWTGIYIRPGKFWPALILVWR